jgi:hypothetical protein
LLDYTTHGRSYRVFNLEANIIVESYDVTFDETAPCPRKIVVSSIFPVTDLDSEDSCEFDFSSNRNHRH